MVLTPSMMLALGTKAPDFELPDVVSGATISLNNFKNQKMLLVMFICRHCPYVQHVKYELARFGKDFANTDLGIIAISSNDVKQYPEDAPEKLREMSQDLGFTFPFCYDGSQEVAKTYTAACTPDFFLFDQKRELVYRGQLDDSRPDTGIPVTGQDLRTAIDSVLSGIPISGEQKPSIGCNIKWIQGNEPIYFRP